jgi:hypothetical protein
VSPGADEVHEVSVQLETRDAELYRFARAACDSIRGIVESGVAAPAIELMRRFLIALEGGATEAAALATVLASVLSVEVGIPFDMFVLASRKNFERLDKLPRQS